MPYADPEVRRAYHREYGKRYRKNNPETVRGYEIKYRDANRDEINQRQNERRDPVKARAATKRAYHGREIDEDFPRMWEEQGGCCYLCSRPMTLEPFKPDSVCIDHDHSTCHPRKGYSCRVCRRGLACDRCNRLIGMVGDDPELLRSIAGRLEEVMKNA